MEDDQVQEEQKGLKGAKQVHADHVYHLVSLSTGLEEVALNSTFPSLFHFAVQRCTAAVSVHGCVCVLSIYCCLTCAVFGFLPSHFFVLLTTCLQSL